MRPRDETLRASLVSIASTIRPATVRQVYYQAEIAGLVPKDERGYKRVQMLVLELREADRLDWSWIVDPGRTEYRIPTWPNMRDNLDEAIEWYRRSMATAYDADVEIWPEKEAGLEQVAQRYVGVGLTVYHGMVGGTALHDLAVRTAERDKPTIIYLIADWDPTGVVAEQTFNSTLDRYGAGAYEVRRLAVTAEQAGNWGLSGRATKTLSDDRNRGNRHYPIFMVACQLNGLDPGRSIEFDAINPVQLRQMVENAIRSHIDPDELAHLQAVEEREREAAERVVEDLPEDVE
jgi:hypothetical protein